MSRDALDAFVAAVAADDDLAENLYRCDVAEFAETVGRAARARGFDVTPSDVDAALARATHRWLMRWIA